MQQDFSIIFTKISPVFTTFGPFLTTFMLEILKYDFEGKLGIQKNPLWVDFMSYMYAPIGKRKSAKKNCSRELENL